MLSIKKFTKCHASITILHPFFRVKVNIITIFISLLHIKKNKTWISLKINDSFKTDHLASSTFKYSECGGILNYFSLFACWIKDGWVTLSLPALVSWALLEDILFYSFSLYSFSLLGGQVKQKIGTKKNKGENSITFEIINILNKEVINF